MFPATRDGEGVADPANNRRHDTGAGLPGRSVRFSVMGQASTALPTVAMTTPHTLAHALPCRSEQCGRSEADGFAVKRVEDGQASSAPDAGGRTGGARIVS